MRTRTALKFNEKELQGLVLDPSSRVRVERNIRHIAVHPSGLGDLKSSVHGVLNSLINKFDQKFSGFILDYKNVKILTDRGTIINDDCFVHFDIEADFYIFEPKIGCTLCGIVNKKSPDHIGCLVHKCFNVSIPRPSEEPDEEWPGTSVGIGDQVTFRVELCDFAGTLPYIRGRVISSGIMKIPLAVKDGMDGEDEPKKKKKRKEKHNEGEPSTESLQAEEEKIEVFHQHKRKRSLDEEGNIGNKKKKKKKSKSEGINSEDHKDLGNHELHFMNMSSEDQDYHDILENLEEFYLNKGKMQKDKKDHKEGKQDKKLGTHTAVVDSYNTITKSDEIGAHASKSSQHDLHSALNLLSNRETAATSDVHSMDSDMKDLSPKKTKRQKYLQSNNETAAVSSVKSINTDMKVLSPKRQKDLPSDSEITTTSHVQNINSDMTDLSRKKTKRQKYLPSNSEITVKSSVQSINPNMKDLSSENTKRQKDLPLDSGIASTSSVQSINSGINILSPKKTKRQIVLPSNSEITATSTVQSINSDMKDLGKKKPKLQKNLPSNSEAAATSTVQSMNSDVKDLSPKKAKRKRNPSISSPSPVKSSNAKLFRHDLPNIEELLARVKNSESKEPPPKQKKKGDSSSETEIKKNTSDTLVNSDKNATSEKSFDKVAKLPTIDSNMMDKRKNNTKQPKTKKLKKDSCSSDPNQLHKVVIQDSGHKRAVSFVNGQGPSMSDNSESKSKSSKKKDSIKEKSAKKNKHRKKKLKSKNAVVFDPALILAKIASKYGIDETEEDGVPNEDKTLCKK